METSIENTNKRYPCLNLNLLLLVPVIDNFISIESKQKKTIVLNLKLSQSVKKYIYLQAVSHATMKMA